MEKHSKFVYKQGGPEKENQQKIKLKISQNRN